MRPMFLTLWVIATVLWIMFALIGVGMGYRDPGPLRDVPPAFMVAFDFAFVLGPPVLLYVTGMMVGRLFTRATG